MNAPRRIPHVYSIIFALILLAALASLVVPPGSFVRVDGQVQDGSFAFDEDLPPDTERDLGERPTGWSLVLAILMAPLRGIAAASDIIAFILIIGGAFKIIEESGAFEAAVRATVTWLGDRRILVIPVAMVIFSIGGAVFGMSEEVLPFVLIFVPLARALGYSAVIGVAIPLVGAGAGFAGAMINPFTLGVAQAIAGLPPLSGWRYRTLVWLLLTVVAVTYVMWQSRRWTLDRDGPREDGDGPHPATAVHLTRTHLGVLASLFAGIVVIVWGIDAFEWYVTEIGAIFLAVGLAAGAIARIGPSRMSRCFLLGGREMLSAALVVGFARGIVLLASDTRILDTTLHGMASVLEHLPGLVSLNLMFVFQSLLNFMVPSGSGQAALTMPIMAPLAELTGLTRQSAVLAFQFGDGFSNLIVPTSAVLMGSLEAGRVPYERWLRFAWPLQCWLALFGVILLSVAYLTAF